MPCYHPLEAWMPLPETVKKTGDKKLKFSPTSYVRENYERIQVSCGQCVGCRLERSRQWAVRCVHEAQMHEQNSFITLTFSPEALAERPNQWSLDVKEFQRFMKRLRKKFGRGIRFFHCGEYGEINKRPHYHACIFGFDFPDKELWKVTETGCKLYTSPSLEKLWPYGFSTIGDVTFESAAYVARYIMKKVTGDAAENYYTWVDDETGEVHPLKPEYTTMSRKPGIGKTWLDSYMDDVYPNDYVVINGKRCNPPRYYDGVLKTERPYEFDEIKWQRECDAQKHLDNNTPDRLHVRETVKLAQISSLQRNL
jgi:hypothetical protein